MAEEIRCPMCSVSNPAELDVCKACGARLKPLIISQPSEGEPPLPGTEPLYPGARPTPRETGPMPPGTEPLRPGDQPMPRETGPMPPGTQPLQPGEQPTSRETSELEETLPSWLQDLRKKKEGAPEPPPAESVEDDWMAQLQPESAEDQPLEPSSATGEEAADWLDSIRSTAAEDPGAEPPLGGREGPDLSGGVTGELGGDEWLDRIQTRQEEEETAQPAPETGDYMDRVRELQSDEDQAAPAPGEDSPDWLSGLSGEEAAPLEAEPAEAAPAEISPTEAAADWLSNLTSGDASPEAEPAAPAEETPDWLAAAPAEAELAEAAPTEAAADWMSDLTGGETSPEAEPAEAEPAVPAEETPDWLAAAPAEAELAEAAPTEAAADWLSDLTGGETSPEAEPAEAEEETPDWMADLSAEEAVPAAEGKEEASDWFSSTTTEEPSEWLGDLTGEEAPAPESEGETPDWISSMAGETAPEAELAEAELAEAESAEETPDWMSGVASQEAPAPEGEGGTPDWINSMAEEVAAPAVERTEETPDWLSGIAEEDAPETETSAESPDWVAGMIEETAEPVDFEAPGPALIGGEEAILGGVRPDGDLPDWLSQLQASTPDITVDDTFPAMVADPGEQTLGEVTDAGFEAIEPANLPTWLSDETATGEVFQAGTTEELAEEGDIAPAALPSWLQAMRPVEAAAAPEVIEEGNQEEVTIGPLAGLRGVLPAEPDVVQFGKTPIYSMRLQVTENQKNHAAILADLVAREKEPYSIRPSIALLSQRVLYWVSALVLIVAVAFPVVSGSMSGKIPSIPPEEVAAVSALINGLPDNAPVLTAFDYEPGFSGELETASEAVLDHLMLKGARLTVISTSPTGPALAEKMIHKSGLKEHGYQHGIQYINLGYLSGGPVGLLQFASDPPQAAPLSIAGSLLEVGGQTYEKIWPDAVQDGAPPLQGVTRLNDFALIVVLVDDPDTARAWVEQVQPLLENTALVMVISAQAEPMVRPYYESVPKQVSGMVTGLTGGAAYQTTTRGPDAPFQARVYWDAYSAGRSVAVGLILLGGMYSLVTALLSRRTPRDDEEALK